MKDSDIVQMQKHGVTQEYVNECLKLFAKGRHYTTIAAPALKDKDIISLNYDDNSVINDQELKIVSFIPASGAATRMFKLLYDTIDEIKKGQFQIAHNDDIQSIDYFFNNIDKFAFYDELNKAIFSVSGINIQEAIAQKQYSLVLDILLSEKGLNYAKLPKALILFHKHKGNPIYAFEEHLIEAAQLSRRKTVYLHFTLSPDHIQDFNNKLASIISKYELRYKCNFDVSYSIQKPSTDTIAVNTNNTPFRNQDDTLLFRPAGHGALIYNMNEIDADIIMIRNIDNVLPESKQQVVIKYRQLMINHILKLNNKRKQLLNKLDKNNNSTEELKSIAACMKSDFKIFIHKDFQHLSIIAQHKLLTELLDRPMRICGMVKNEGEVGGGPFIVIDKKDNQSLQIVEGAQINHKDKKQEEIFKASTHFNPVDIICMTRDRHGKKYDLTKYIDHEAYFISDKFKDGKPLKALELPGLWNGAMSNWITIFAEVPVATFNPVKTVNDLLRVAHLSE